jgi:predicted transport protein
MEQKLLFEVDIADETEPISEKAQLLRLISRGAVEAGELDNFGERVFTDARVRGALESLAADGDEAVVAAIGSRLGKPTVPPDAIRKSLARILDFKIPTAVQPSPTPASKPAVGPPVPPRGQEYKLEHHLGNKSALMRELFEEIDKHAFTLGPDVARRIRKQYIGYFRGKRSFFTVEIQQRRLIVYMSLDPAAVSPWNENAMRDTTEIGHFGMGDLEYSLRAVQQLDELRALAKTAYDYVAR